MTKGRKKKTYQPTFEEKAIYDRLNQFIDVFKESFAFLGFNNFRKIRLLFAVYTFTTCSEHDRVSLNHVKALTKITFSSTDAWIIAGKRFLMTEKDSEGMIYMKLHENYKTMMETFIQKQDLAFDKIRGLESWQPRNLTKKEESNHD